MDRDRVVLIGEDGRRLRRRVSRCPRAAGEIRWERVIEPDQRVRDRGAAVGMGYAGLRPVAEMQFIDFTPAASSGHEFRRKVALPLGRAGAAVLRGPCGGGVHGGPFPSANPEMYFVHTPASSKWSARDALRRKGLLKSAIRDNIRCFFSSTNSSTAGSKKNYRRVILLFR